MDTSNSSIDNLDKNDLDNYDKELYKLSNSNKSSSEEENKSNLLDFDDFDDSDDEFEIITTAAVVPPTSTPTAPFRSFYTNPKPRFEQTKNQKTKAIIDLEHPGNIDGLPTVEFDINSLTSKPWEKEGVNIEDYFNFGFNPDRWVEYCAELKTVPKTGLENEFDRYKVICADNKFSKRLFKDKKRRSQSRGIRQRSPVKKEKDYQNRDRYDERDFQTKNNYESNRKSTRYESNKQVDNNRRREYNRQKRSRSRSEREICVSSKRRRISTSRKYDSPKTQINDKRGREAKPDLREIIDKRQGHGGNSNKTHYTSNLKDNKTYDKKEIHLERRNDQRHRRESSQSSYNNLQHDSRKHYDQHSRRY